tara:strand:- start:415 stop:912 length:498 start_codon:yes stop_codon:yes gene_type:complete
MQVTQTVNVHTFMSSELKKLNSKLHNTIIEYANTEDFGAMMTSWNHEDKHFNKIVKVVRRLILDADVYNTTKEIWELHLKDLWGQIYNEGAHQVSHHHNPHSWSFCYYVNTPKGSSPMVFSDGSEIIAEEGKIVIFPSWLYHEVPPNKCKDRSVICGNFIYKIMK